MTILFETVYTVPGVPLPIMQVVECEVGKLDEDTNEEDVMARSVGEHEKTDEEIISPLAIHADQLKP